ncbi:hypothetical protein PVA19_15215 [Agrobacterium sp. CNPSo 3708]|uniref:hypothetical protein n=1 Tax=Agrobacterium sp. CNPSo 3708 TaxID=3028150 RepID=UPI00236487D5|nr:hypothetical protein [Agrobacterium sp. CNPSo 3708]MDD1499771.1 hypothetical protein [Agrobacterium sp. CNPSo 3708]
MAEKTSLFRVHFEDGSHHDVNANDAQDARKLAKQQCEQRDTIINKIKLVRGGANG